jgi:adenine-specific DNA-methyltransferase
MELIIQSPSKSLNKAYLKEKVARKDIELFKEQLTLLFTKVQAGYSEDTLKDYITEFLRNTWYNPHHAITINKERKDLTIHTGKTAKDPAAVIAEIKKIDSSEMMSPGKPNVKALHELVLYYMQERVTTGNNEIKFLLATDVNNWILIDANEFDKKIYRNTKIKKLFDVFFNDKKDNPFFYDELKKILTETEDAVYATQFNLNDYKKVITNADKADDKKLIALYKILSPSHLLKLPFTNDSNSLDKSFYAELLHLIGLEEVKEGSKKLIQRKKESSEASLLENAIIKLKDKDCLRDVPDVTRFGFTSDEQYYNIALELCITWVNRILFLKLLEAQLHTYHLGDKQYLFLNDQLIHDYDELNNLFLQVLAEKPETRRERLQTKFSKVPYLNSSLFERTELERKTIDISALDNSLPLQLHNNTVLKDDKGKRRQGQLHILSYLFSFLDSYDFTSESSADIQEENKTLINASVLGLIFEKINGYKDGSFFTPGFITMYMCRETLRRAVVQKFNEVNGWQCKTFEELQGHIEFQDKEKRKQANAIINSLTICDIAVGSGHFLVSGLNELIAIKHDLKILQYRHNGQRIKEYSIEIVNDELIIQDIESEELFEYTLNQKGNIKPELQYLQETLFHEKETLIENCLFGVDINANSVKICRLRLWIELLKNAYYTKESNYTQLETLPNIDINIKQGNSLISRFALDADLSATLKKSKWTIDSYKLAVQTYRNAQSKEEKRQMEELIDTIKKDFRTDVVTYDPINKKLSKLRGELAQLQQTDLFSSDIKKKTKANKELEKLSAAIEKLEKEKEDIQNNAIYKEAFEWRFEFPEVLDSEGKFLGFDVMVGNPPYIALQKMKQEQAAFERLNYDTYAKLADIYCLFYEKGIQLLKHKGLLTYITSNSWMRTQYGELLRKYFAKNTNPILLLNIEDTQVFEEATVESNIIILEKGTWTKQLKAASLHEDFNTGVSLEDYFTTNSITVSDLPESGWTIGNELEATLKVKVEKGSKLIKDFDYPVNYGLKTGFNEAFFISTEIKNKLVEEDSKCKDLIKPALRGKDISKYNYIWKDIWIILLKQGWTNENKGKEEGETFFSKAYPSVYNFLKTTGETIKGKGKGLFERDDKGDYWWELRPCAYYDDFEKEKIVWGELSDEQKFAFDDSGLYANNSIFFITGKNLKYLLSVLNSKLAKWYFDIISTSSGMGTNRWLKYKIEQLPIKDISVAQQLPFITLADKILVAKKENPKADTSGWEKEIDQLVYQLYGLSEAEIKMVESN